MTDSPTIDVNTWLSDDHLLVRKIGEFLPSFRTSRGFLDVNRLAGRMSITKEGVYKWLRRDKITAKRVHQIISISQDAENRAALTKAGKAPPTITDFADFL